MISIIIPTYNEEKIIGKTLSELKAKLTLPHEIIVTDDKSKDRTAEIARAYADQVLVPEKKHRTISANRNYGATFAHGHYLAFLDADSTIADPNTFFTHAISQFEADPGLMALTGKIGVWPELETWSDRVVYFFFNATHYLKNNVFKMGEGSGKFQMMTRTAFDTVGGYREDLVTGEDGDMFGRLAKAGKTKYVGNLVVLHQGRRAHRIGWPKLLCIWMIERFWVAVFGKSRSKVWVDIR
ncbi:MAG TPA: glycosyltransferase [Candidatus Paceibacterota bacterium]